MSSVPTRISLDPPYRIERGQRRFIFHGWAEVDDEAAPDIALALNGKPIPVTAYPMPTLKDHFPGMKGVGFHTRADFPDAVPTPDPARPFLLEAAVRSDGRKRTFEYAVSQDWLDEVFPDPPRARPVPPEHLQIRVTGAAAGAFVATGRAAADQVAALVAKGGQPITAYQRILDFGCGCGRVISPLADLHPGAQLAGCDIDHEAIAWCAGALGHLAEFKPNGTAPPLPWADGAFDLVYGLSVFTHLPEDLQWAWLADLERVVRPGGLVLTTVLNPEAYDIPAEIKAAAATGGGFAYWADAATTEGLPGFYRLAYHSHDYVRREWSRHFDVLHLGDHDLNDTQNAVLLQRR